MKNKQTDNALVYEILIDGKWHDTNEFYDRIKPKIRLPDGRVLDRRNWALRSRISDIHTGKFDGVCHYIESRPVEGSEGQLWKYRMPI